MKAFNIDSMSNFLAYMVPKKRKREEEDDQREELEWIREYSFEMKKGNEFADTFFFTFGEDSASYNSISTRINLTKIKAKGAIYQPSSITSSRKKLTEQEIVERKTKKSQLLLPDSISSVEDGETKEEEIYDEEEGTKE